MPDKQHAEVEAFKKLIDMGYEYRSGVCRHCDPVPEGYDRYCNPGRIWAECLADKFGCEVELIKELFSG